MNVVGDFVIDASVTLAWCYEDEQTPHTQALLTRLDSDNAFAPSLWPLEVSNVLLVGERRGRLTQAQITAFLVILRALPISIDTQAPTRVFADLLALARAHRLSVYDAAYLELALRLALPLATLDGDLQRAAQALGIPLL